MLALSACYEEEDKTLPAGDASTASPAATAPAPASQPQWLEVNDARDPAEYLASQTGTPPDQITGPLQMLAAHYRESPRMIANRVLQLWQEYPGMSLPLLMRDLVPAEQGAEHSLGPIAQHYRVLRDKGQPHAAAIAAAMEIKTGQAKTGQADAGQPEMTQPETSADAPPAGPAAGSTPGAAP